MIPSDLKPIPEFPDYYARKDGTVWSMKRTGKKSKNPGKPKFCRKDINKRGYAFVSLYVNQRRHRRKVAYCVLTAFVSPRPNGMYVCHGVSGKTDDSLGNLYWETPHQNQMDKHRDGTMPLGESHPRARFTEEEIVKIRTIRKHFLLTYAEIAKDFGCSKSAIAHVIKQRVWRHVNQE